jgi:LAO/AO transport system kinase
VEGTSKSPQPSLSERFARGDKGALARAISWAENNDPRFPALFAELWPKVGRARRIGVTGPPGAGKSTLVNELARATRAQGRTVGILAVDPSSPFTGGALLGDRIRMEERTADSGVYIRSMASRKSHGGLSRAAVDACDAIDAFGIDDVVLETVGVGQAEYDVVSAADTVLVVLCPGAGDGIQAMKAGILEVADVLVVNKAELPGADRLVVDLSEAAHIRTAGRGRWTPPVVAASAGRGEGIEDVLAAIEAHRAHLGDAGLAAARREKRVAQVRRVFDERLSELLWDRGGWTGRARGLLDGGASTYDVVARLVAGMAAQLQEQASGATPGRGSTT